MKTETKESLYSMLDMIDALGSVDFMKVDIDKVNRIRKDVLDIINEKNDIEKLENNSEEILGVLPIILLDTKRFQSAKDVLFFAEKCLNIQLKNYWFKRSKAEVVGIVISEVKNQTPEQLSKFLKAWKKFNMGNGEIGEVSEKSEQGFMDTWFKFFENYKGMK